MGRVRRRFDAQFKEQICQQVLAGTDIREICRDHQLGRPTVEYWLKKFQDGDPLSRPTAREKFLEKQVEKLHATIGQMTVHIELLKKIQKTSQQKKSVDGSVITGSNLARFQKLVKP